MKKYFSLTILLSTTTLLTAQTGNVGIGTTTPQARLHIFNTTGGNGGFVDGILVENNNTTTGEAAISFRNAGVDGSGSKYWITGMNQVRNFSWAYGTSFTNVNTRMLLDSTGRLGLGTASPLTKLHLFNTSGGNGSFEDGILIDNTDAVTGESAISFRNAGADGSGSKYWITGMNENRNFSWAYGAGFTSANTRMMLDSTGRLGINTTSPKAALHVKDSNVLFSGRPTASGTPGNPPDSGAGIRMMWYPDKAAFRAGEAISEEWNKDNIGYYSKAVGFNTAASGLASSATGFSTTAPGDFSTAMGYSTGALGVSSTAMGYNTRALGDFSTAMSANTTASGRYSLAMGFLTTASAYASVSIGRYNNPITSSSPDAWVPTDPLFIIGNGSSGGAQNALIVLKNARTGINTSSPQAMLHVEGNAQLGANGTVFDELIKITINKNIATVSANDTGTEIFAVSNAQPGSTVYVSPANALPNGLVIAYARVSVANVVEVKFTNTTSSSLNPGAMDFYITVIR
jgi:hypothetical protein